MSTILMALSLGAVSMIITFLAGLASGVVRVGTIALRSCFAFCLASAACYFILMLFDLYNERLQRETEQVEEEVAAEDEEATSNQETEAPQENFQPTENYPNA